MRKRTALGAFYEAENVLVTFVKLNYLNDDENIVVTITDVSLNAVSVFLQQTNGESKPIFILSLKLNSSQMKYNKISWELLTINLPIRQKCSNCDRRNHWAKMRLDKDENVGKWKKHAKPKRQLKSRIMKRYNSINLVQQKQDELYE